MVVIGPGSRADLIAVRATWGLAVSDDGGRRFRFLCEDAFQYIDGYDPTIAINHAGVLLVGVPDGLQGTSDFCDPLRRDDLRGQHVVDLATDATGRTVVAGVMSSDAEPVTRIARSSDGGGRFELSQDTWTNAEPLTVEVAPGDARRAYATIRVRGDGSLVFARSDDGAARWRRTAARFTGAGGAYIAGVDPTRPDVVYVRVTTEGAGLDGSVDASSALLQSDDGGESFREVARTRGAMRGFAVSGDGRQVWVGGADARDGLSRRDGAGEFRQVSPDPVECLRWHAGALYVCEGFVPNGVFLTRSTDGGATREVLARYGEILGPPPGCAQGSLTRDICPLRWGPVRDRIAPRVVMDGAVSDRPTGGVDDGGEKPGDCGCRASGTRARGGGWWIALVMMACGWRRRGR